MAKISLLGASALQSAFFAGTLIVAQPALAQQAPASSTTPAPSPVPALVEAIPGGSEPDSVSLSVETQPSGQDDAIVVTGSRIRRPNLDSQVPVTSVGGKEFFETGQVSIGDVLNELPALRSTFSQGNSTRFLGTAGLNLLDLRGLGTERTLVLVNGRRHVGGDVLSTGISPDVNTFPTDLIERVDIVTGGSSAIYGSDAIAGVVNFILKKDFEGAQLRAQGGVSKYGDAGAFFVSGLIGTNFADNRGNVALNVEYARQNQYFADGRPLARQDGFVIVDTDPAGSINGSDGVPDRRFVRDIRNAGLTNTGVVRFGGAGAGPLGCGTDAAGAQFNCAFTFLRDGSLVPLTGTRVGIAPSGSFIGGNGENFRGGEQFQLTPNLNRYNVNLLAHFEISPALVPFIEAKFSRTDVSGTGSSGPAFITGAALGDFAGPNNRETISINNPYLTPQARALIVQQRTLNGQTTTANTRFSVRENLTGLGARTEVSQRDTYRIVGGVRGEFNDDWNYEFALNYGRLREETQIRGNLNIQRFLLANDAVRDPRGNIVCRSTIDPAARIGYVNNGGAQSAAVLAADVAACTPINVLGGNFTQAQRDYLLADTTAVGKTSQLNATAFVSGDTSQFLNLPGGPVGFALGAEYRRDSLSYLQDPLVTAGYTFYNAIPEFKAPKNVVKEAFGEIRLPILKNVALAHELTVTAAGRVSDYKVGKTGTVYAYNFGAEYAPSRDLRLRANYSRAVRAPNQAELFSLPGQNFATGFGDPCASRNIGTGSLTRAANCAAAGRPAGFDFSYPDGSLETVSGGNTELEAEKSNSYTYGGVLTPAAIPGLSISADYYNITVNKVITTPTAQQIANACYDAADLNNQFCALFRRAPAGGAPTGEEAFRIIEGSLLQVPLNYAKLRARGIDVEVAYRGNLGDIAKLDTRFTYTHVLERSQFLNPAEPNREDRIVSELGDPQDSFNWSVDLKGGPVTLGYQMRYVSKMLVSTYEDVFSLQGRPAENLDFADRRYYPRAFYHDVRVGFDATKKYNFYVGVDNVTNKMPPLGLTGITGGSSIYDVRGRSFYAGAVAKF